MSSKRIWEQFLLLLFMAIFVFGDEENAPSTMNIGIEEQYNTEDIASPAPSDNIPETIGLHKSSTKKPHHHSRQRDHLDKVQSNRSPVYEVVSQPCYSAGCRGYDQFEMGQGMGPGIAQNGGQGAVQGGGYRWPSRGNRMMPYPQPIYEPRRRGTYPPPDYYPDTFYGPREPDYGGYGQRGAPGYQGRYGNFGGYNQQYYPNRFLG